ncbi:MAG TPA: ABC transporter ATP-binding protein [Candidatus Dormibacteraeota bacterium]|nr:ABC transporter ATP-binding protein [Candidatus Dormibacteraeota bacterium]
MTATAPELRVEGLEAGYYAGQSVLRGVDLRAAPGKLTVILGPNGAGKSTALRVLAGLLPPAAGRVLVDGHDITRVPAHGRARLGIAFLPQGRSVFAALTVHQNLELGGWILRRRRQDLDRALEAAYERYPKLRPLRDRPAGSLSGGQQRLVEIARMMIADPRLILIDEPSAGLAPNLTEEVYEELARLRVEGRTVLLVDQNVRAAVEVADYVFTLESGRNHLEGDRERFERELGALIRAWLRV